MNNLGKNNKHPVSFGGKILVGFLLTVILIGSFALPIRVDPSNYNGILVPNIALAETTSNPELGTGVPECWESTGFIGKLNIAGCIAWGAYGLFFYIPSLIAYGAAMILDFFIEFSIDDDSYRMEFVDVGWKLLRDIANLAFIFLFIFIAFRVILGLGGVGGTSIQKMVTTILIVALLINFSLFFTRVLIDATNILAHVFYDSIQITGKDGLPKTEERKAISEAIIDQIDPQQIMSASVLEGISTPGKKITPDDPIKQKDGNSTAWYFATISILSGVVIIYLIGVYLAITLLLVGRVVGLLFLMILAPLAFISLIVPALRKRNYIGWDSWLKNLTGLAFVAPVFLFFLYLILQFIKTALPPLKKAFGDDVSGFMVVIKVMIPFIFIIFLLLQAKKISKDLAGEIGAGVAAIGKKAVAGVAMVALGGAGAIAGRMAAGRLAGTAGAKLRAAAPTSRMARMQLRGLEAVGQGRPATWAARRLEEGVGAAPPAIKTTLKGVGMGVEEGGYMGQQEKLRDSIKADAKLAMLSDRQIAAQTAKHEIWNDKYKEDRDAKREAEGEDFKESEFRNKYETKIPYVMTGKEINSITKKDFADRIEYGGKYVENLKEAQKKAKKDNKVFDENSWRQDQKTIPRTMSLGEEQAVSAVRADALKDLPPEFTKKPEDLSKLEKNIDKTNSQLAKNGKILQAIANKKTDGDVSALTQTDVREEARHAELRGSDQITYASDLASDPDKKGSRILKSESDRLQKGTNDLETGKIENIKYRGKTYTKSDLGYLTMENNRINRDLMNLKDLTDEIKGSLNEKDKLTTTRTKLRTDRWG